MPTAPQTEVLDDMLLGYPGQVADSSPSKVGVSKFSEEASAEIRAGIFLKGGTDDQGALILTATTNRLIGVSMREQAVARGVEVGDTGFKPKVYFSVLDQGHIWVFPEDAVTPASEVHVRAVAGGSEVAGAVRGTADGTDTINVSAFCRWLTSGDATTGAILQVDMPNAALAVAD